jgi:hypothetical protein
MLLPRRRLSRAQDWRALTQSREVEMTTRTLSRRLAWMSAGATVAFGLGHVGSTWFRYGRARVEPGADPLLDRFLPACDVRERHTIRVAAPVEDTWAATLALDLRRSRLVRAIFRGRELLMGAEPAVEVEPQPLLPWALALGWGLLAEEPGRQVVLGGVTRPWEANPVFRALPPAEFADFAEPRCVKIAWTLAAAPLGSEASLAATETRVSATDAYARRRFRPYWTLASPGIVLIRRQALRLVGADAERRYRDRRAAEAHAGSGVAGAAHSLSR